MLNLRSKTAINAENRAQVRLAMAFEKPMAAALKREFNRVARQAANEVLHTHAFSQESAASEHKASLARIYHTAITPCFKAFATRAYRAIRGEIKALDDGNEDWDSNVSEYLKKHGAKNVQDVSDTTIKRIKKALKGGYDNSKSWADIADDIVRVTGGIIGDARADMIAATEMHSAANAGNMAGAEEAAQSAGVDTYYKIWHATIDDRTRDSHLDADGQTVNKDDSFNVGDDELDFPGDPDGSPEEIINCRCTMSFTMRAPEAQEEEDITSNDVLGSGVEGDEKGLIQSLKNLRTILL